MVKLTYCILNEKAYYKGKVYPMTCQSKHGGRGGIAPTHLKPRREKGMGQQVLQGDKIKDG
jgi:hypothetical protein